MRRNGTIGTIVAATAALGACASRPSGGEVAWEPIPCHTASAPIERVRTGRPDPTDPALQAVCVDQAGDVALIRFDGSAARSEVIFRNGKELSALAIADVDATVEGPEIYVGGDRGNSQTGDGAVLQLVLTKDPAQRVVVRRVYQGPDFVHAVERVGPRGPNDVARLLVTTYGGEIHLLTPTKGEGEWDDRVLYRDPKPADPEAPKIKDLAFLRDAAGNVTRRAIVALKGGRTLLLDVDRPAATKLVHEEPGGLSRVTADASGGAYLTGYWGRVLHLVPDGAAFRVDVIDEEGKDSGLRGLVLGDFPVGGGVRSTMAVFGFHKRCRALVAHGDVLDPVTLYVDPERGHTIEAADVVAGNGADEILLGGYGKRVTMLVAKRGR